MGCDGGSNRVAGCLHKSNGIGCSDMLKHDLEAGEIAHDLAQDAVDEHGLTVKDIDVGLGHFTMQQKRHANFFHRRKHGIELLKVRHAMAGIGGGVGGIKLAGGEDAGLKAVGNINRIAVIGQITSHQRRKVEARINRRRNPVAISRAKCCRGDRWRKVWHDNGAGKLARRVIDNSGQHRAIAQMHVPIIRSTYREAGQACLHVIALRRHIHHFTSLSIRP